MPEFTGERVVPGLVDSDLYNEHFARYEFAARLASGKRVLDAGCGTGYGSAELAKFAAEVTAIDLSAEAISFARQNFAFPNLHFEIGSCSALPPGPFDLIVAFEVIEHLAEWRDFLAEARRVLAPGGRFLVSTPNKLYYAESRGESGDNPFHLHEFEFAEFSRELESVYPYVGMFLQNHVEGVAFFACEREPEAPDTRVPGLPPMPDEAHFFLAVCALDPLPEVRPFLSIPGTGNILRARERHISLLNHEVELKTKWLDLAKADAETLLLNVRDLNAQLEQRNRWALEARDQAERRGARILALQEELGREQANFAQVAAGYESKVAELEDINQAKTEWARATERRLTEEISEKALELARCVELLDRAEETVTERTLWAQTLQKRHDELHGQLTALRAAPWVKAGSRLRLVPGHHR